MRRITLFLLLFGILSGPATAQDAENLLENFSFETGDMGPWFTYGQASTEVVQELVGAAVPESPVEGDHAFRVTLETAPPNFWEMGLGQAEPFEAGKIYTFSLFMKTALGDITVNVKPERGSGDFQAFGEQQVTVTERWTEFSVTTPVMEEDVTDGRVVLHLGFAAGTLWIDGARLYEGEYVEPDFGPGDPKARPCPIASGIEFDPEIPDVEIDHTIRWRNGDTLPSRLDISRNGDVFFDDVDVAAEAFVDEGVEPGAYSYELNFEVEGEVCEPVTMEVDTCISGLFASVREEGVRLTWDNARRYGAVLILRDGEEIDDVAGDSGSYIDADAPLGPVTYEVVPDEGICTPAIFFIEVTEPKEEGENVLGNPGFEDELLEPWLTYGNVTVEAVDDLAEAAIPEDPVEGTKALRIDVPVAGANPWDAGLQQSYPLDEGVVYTLSAFVKSAQGEKIVTFKPERGCCGFQGFGEQQVTVGEEWTEFSVTTPPMPETVPEGMITFHVASSAGIIWMDGIRFYKGEYVPPDFGEPPLEICDDELDNDDDGLADCEDPDCADTKQCADPVSAFVRGDVDASGSINLSDGISLLLFQFQGGESPACGDAADTDDSGSYNLTDAIVIFQWLFLGGNPPVDPMPSAAAYIADDCGGDLTDDAFDCAAISPVCSN